MSLTFQNFELAFITTLEVPIASGKFCISASSLSHALGWHLNYCKVASFNQAYLYHLSFENELMDQVTTFLD